MSSFPSTHLVLHELTVWNILLSHMYFIVVADKPAKHPFIMCQVCQQDIGALDVDARTRHVNACIDNSVSSTSTADMELSTDVNNKEVCAVCHKKLGHLNILRRQQHVNRCMDKVSDFNFNSLAPGRFQFNFRKVIFKLTLVNGGWGISNEIALRWMPLDLTDDKATLV